MRSSSHERKLPQRRQSSIASGHVLVARQKARHGTATVEFALVSSMLFLFVFTSIEFGRMQMVYHGLETAAREGCRASMSWQATQQSVTNAVTNRLQTFGIVNHTLTTVPDPVSSASEWQPITVRVEVPYGQVSWLPVPRFLQGITLDGSCTLPKEAVDSGS
jgi:Flp pilus assembly protein TadG